MQCKIHHQDSRKCDECLTPAPQELINFDEGEHTTHYVCSKIIGMLGEISSCCFCNKHQCVPPTPQEAEGWERRFEKEFVYVVADVEGKQRVKFEGFAGWTMDEIKTFIAAELKAQEQELKAEVRAVLDRCLEKPELAAHKWETKKRVVNYIAGELEL